MDESKLKPSDFSEHNFFIQPTNKNQRQGIWNVEEYILCYYCAALWKSLLEQGQPGPMDLSHPPMGCLGGLALESASIAALILSGNAVSRASLGVFDSL
jgi:hypothetical protein